MCLPDSCCHYSNRYQWLSDLKQQQSCSCFALFSFFPTRPYLGQGPVGDSLSLIHVGSGGATHPGAGRPSWRYGSGARWASWCRLPARSSARTAGPGLGFLCTRASQEPLAGAEAACFLGPGPRKQRTVTAIMGYRPSTNTSIFKRRDLEPTSPWEENQLILGRCWKTTPAACTAYSLLRLSSLPERLL